jgi:hypothetical protein
MQKSRAGARVFSVKQKLFFGTDAAGPFELRRPDLISLLRDGRIRIVGP